MNAPPEGTIERWAWDYVHADSLAMKIAPPPLPKEWEEAPAARRIAVPGRPPELVLAERAPKTPRAGALREPRRRGELLHAFFHHELQAAELMCWACLAFPDAPRALRRGLIGICLDEVRHMNMYGEHMDSLGVRFGDAPVHDWFWKRIPQAPTIGHYLATMGIGFEGGNLDHTRRFAESLRAAGDSRAAQIEEAVGEEEVPHVRFAIHWFTGGDAGLDFDVWRAHLPQPLTPTVMQGRPLHREARVRAGFSEAFVDRLGSWDAPSS